MKETEWNECGDIKQMLDFVKGDRKKRLFACACVRQVWHLLEDNRSKQAVIISEQFADGLVSEEKLWKVRSAAWSAYDAVWSDAAAAAVVVFAVGVPVTTYIPLLKDIFDPFIQKPKVNETIIHFANEIYNNPNENGFFNSKDLNILTDMLCDEGYDNDHLRNGKHIRGCQLIDLILGKQ